MKQQLKKKKSLKIFEVKELSLKDIDNFIETTLSGNIGGYPMPFLKGLHRRKRILVPTSG
jgi:hypothetical protein